jgi:hypothetical protein
MSKLETNTVDSISGTSTLTLGGSNASVVSAGTEVRSNKLSPASGTALQIGDSGDTITIPSGATIVNSGTQTGFGGTNTPLVFAQRVSSNQSISATTWTKVIFDTEYLDTGSIYNTSTGEVTIADAGKYFVSVSVNIRALTGASDYASIFISNSARNASGIASNYVSGQTGTGYHAVTCSQIKSYSASDTIAVWTYGSEAYEIAEPASAIVVCKMIE